MNNLNFDKYKNIKTESFGTLWSPDFRDVSKKICPYCSRKLYEMYNKPLLFCKNKLHKKAIFKVK